MEVKANLTEPNTSNKMKQPSKRPKLNKAKKFKESFYNCGKLNQLAKNYHLPKKGNKTQAHMIKDKNVPLDLSELDLLAIIFDANLMDNPRDCGLILEQHAVFVLKKDVLILYSNQWK